jgi:hypothetical protein
MRMLQRGGIPMIDPLKWAVEAFLAVWNELPVAFSAFFIFVVILAVLSFIFNILK